MGAPASDDVASKRFDQGIAMQGVLILEVFVRMVIWALALAITIQVGTPWIKAMGAAWPQWGGSFRAAWQFSAALAKLIVLYNVVYLMELFVLRLLVPRPRSGRFSLASGRLDATLFYSCLLGILTKARYRAPFPAILVSQLANIFP